MNKSVWVRFPDSFSDNRKPVLSHAEGSKIQNPKWVGYFAFVIALTVCGAGAEAQQPKEVMRICYLSNTDLAAGSVRAEAIWQRLREYGYMEGQNIVIDYRYGEGKRERASKLAAELVALKCDVIVVAGGYSWIRAVMAVTKTIPIVMTGGGLDPVDAGLVKSLARPGGNVTGTTGLGPQLRGKQLELFKEAVPKLARVAALYDSADPDTTRWVKEDFPALARELKLVNRSWEVRDANSFEQVFITLNKERADGIYVVSGGGLMSANGNLIARLAVKSRLPSMYINKQFVEVGGLMSYAADVSEINRRVAYYVDKILKGAKPADLPVEQPTKFEFVINQKTAKQIGLTIPADVLARATTIIR